MELLSIINKFCIHLISVCFFCVGDIFSAAAVRLPKTISWKPRKLDSGQNDRLDRPRSAVIGAGSFGRSLCLFFVIQQAER
jgi:hypothetical protein